MADQIVTPIVHLNGTSKEALLEQREVVYQALRTVERALCQMAPNGRDYYPEPGRMDKAQAQHERRMGMVKTLLDEVMEEACSIDREG